MSKYLKYGLTDKNLNTILPTEYDNISFCKGNDTNIEIIKRDSNGDRRVGRTNKYGKIIIEPIYSSISRSKVNGKYQVRVDGFPNNLGLADIQTGHIDVEPQYSCIDQLKNDQILVEKFVGNVAQYGVLDKNYKLIIPIKYDDIRLMNGHKYYRARVKTLIYRYAILDVNGKIILPLEYTWIDEAGITNKDGSPRFDYTIVKDSVSYKFNSLTGEVTEEVK